MCCGSRGCVTNYCLIATLVDAQFVGAFDAADKVYFMLREIAIEQINCAKVRSTSPTSTHA